MPRSPSLISTLLAGKNPAELLEASLSELENNPKVTPKRRRALLRLAAVLLELEAQRVQAKENGHEDASFLPLAEVLFDRQQAHLLASALEQQWQSLYPCRARGRQVPLKKAGSPSVTDTVDLVHVFRDILDRVRARKGKSSPKIRR